VIVSQIITAEPWTPASIVAAIVLVVVVLGGIAWWVIRSGE
jgi:hypothetical protein